MNKIISISEKEAEKIVYMVGKAVIKEGVFKPQSLLPCSPEKIRQAFRVFIKSVIKHRGSLSKDLGESLVTVYSMMDAFIEDNKAEKFNQILRDKPQRARESGISQEDIDECFELVPKAIRNFDYYREINDFIERTNIKNQTGFISLLVIGVVTAVIVGSTITITSVLKSDNHSQPAKVDKQEEQINEQNSDSEMDRLESKIILEDKKKNDEIGGIKVIILKDDTREICDKALKQNDPTGKSLLTQIHNICSRLLSGEYTLENIDIQEDHLHEIWSLWEKTKEEEVKAAKHQNEKDDRKSEETEKVIYNTTECLTQKNNLLPQVEATYLKWYEEWQNDRKILVPCYENNPIPICDKQMTNLNVEWQDKITVAINEYHSQLLKCAPSEREFGSISNVIPSPY